MRVPILKQGNVLIASVQSVLSDDDLLQLRDDLVVMAGQSRSRGVVIDVTALDVLDSYAARTLSTIARMLKLRGAETVIVGIQPDVAFAMVQLGLTLDGVATALDLEEGLALIRQGAQEGGAASPSLPATRGRVSRISPGPCRTATPPRPDSGWGCPGRSG